MQTFLPYSNFEACAQSIDDVRLNKQIVECQQILMALSGEMKAYKNHPAILMWKGHEGSLFQYAGCCAHEYFRRSGKDSHGSYAKMIEMVGNNYSVKLPWWFNDDFEYIKITHRSRLIHKGRVDRIRKCFRNKQEWLDFNAASKVPKQWYALLPHHADLLEEILKPDGENPYQTRWPDLDGRRAYIWPTDSGYKTKPNKKWIEWKPGQPIPELVA